MVLLSADFGRLAVKWVLVAIMVGWGINVLLVFAQVLVTYLRLRQTPDESSSHELQKARSSLARPREPARRDSAIRGDQA
jgi:hypothetical protein